MKKIIQFMLIIGILFLCQLYVSGQTNQITLVHNNTSAFFNNLTPALAAAANGDTIYLPGGGIPASSTIIINKLLTIVGAGHYPDSTSATYQTLLTDIYIVSGADGGSISGIKCNSITFGTTPSDQNVNNYSIERCYIGYLRPSQDASGTSQNILISENIIAGIAHYNFQAYEFSSVLFEKNIFFRDVFYQYAGMFNNNIFYITGNNETHFPGYNSIYVNSIIIVDP